METCDHLPSNETQHERSHPEVVRKLVLCQDPACQRQWQDFLFLNRHLHLTSGCDKQVDVMPTIKLRFEATCLADCGENEMNPVFRGHQSNRETFIETRRLG